MGYTLWGVPIPGWLGDWIEELLSVPRATRLTLIWLGFMTGLAAAGVAVMIGVYLSIS